MDGVEGVYISSDDVTDYGGQKSNLTTEISTETTTETIRLLIKDTPKITGKDKVKAFQSVFYRIASTKKRVASTFLSKFCVPLSDIANEAYRHHEKDYENI